MLFLHLARTSHCCSKRCVLHAHLSHTLKFLITVSVSTALKLRLCITQFCCRAPCSIIVEVHACIPAGRLSDMHPRNRWCADTPHCAFGQPVSAGDPRQDPLLSRKKRFSWQRPSSPASEAPPFMPKRPLLGSCQPSTSSEAAQTATQVGNLTAFPPACPIKPYIGAPGTVHQAYSLALQMQVTEWVRLARLAAPHSSALPEVLKSTKADMHLAKMVDSYAPSTLAAYLSKWRHWIRFASACEANPYNPSIALLLDFLATHSRGQLRTATTWIKSLRFISRKAHLDALRLSLHSEFVSAYGRSGSIIERRESAPLPPSFVIFLERRILDTSLSAQQRIIAGSFLLCIFASLRFSDALWCPPGRLSITGECGLGVCMKTKTTRRAMPFGALAGGFLHRGAQGWAHAWLHLVQVALQATAMLHPNFTPDFLLARLLSPYFLRPCRGLRALCCYASSFPFAMRRHSHLLGPRLIYWEFTPSKLHYSVTVGNFLIREDLQRQQGHHRSSLAGMSDLYGRDDVAAPLEFQRQVVAAVLEGFRPRRPRLRGGLPPTMDIEVDLPCVTGASDMPPVGSNPVPEAEHDTSSDSEVEDERAASPIPLPPSTQELPEAVTESLSVTLEPLPQDASSSSGAADDWTDVRGQADEFFFLLNGMSHIAHKAQPCSTSHPAFQVMVPHLKLSLRAGCSVRGVESLQFSEFVPEGFRMCLKRGCLLD